MNFKKISLGLAATAAMTTALSAPAHAFSVTFGGSTTPISGPALPNDGLFSTVVNSETVTFNDATAPQEVSNATPYTSGLATYRSPGSQTGTGPGRIVKGKIGGRHLPPTDDIRNYLTLGSSQERGPVEISFAKRLNYFGLYWGSVDHHNSIAFYRGNQLIKGFGQGFSTTIGDLFTGQTITPLGTVSHYVNFFAGPDETFNRVVLRAGTAAFESDNHAYRAIPTPALLPGLIGMGLAAFRKRKGEQAGQPEEVKA